MISLQRRHNGHDDARNHLRLDCLFNVLFRRRSKLRVTGLCWGNPPVTGKWNPPVTSGSPHKGPVTRKMFPFDDVIMTWENLLHGWLGVHDGVIKWKHFPRYWPFVRGIQRSPLNSQHKGQWRRALMFTLICARINGWVNNHEASDLRRHRAHYDVIVMWWL